MTTWTLIVFITLQGATGSIEKRIEGAKSREQCMKGAEQIIEHWKKAKQEPGYEFRVNATCEEKK